MGWNLIKRFWSDLCYYIKFHKVYKLQKVYNKS